MARALVVSILGDARQFGAELDKAAGKTRSLGKVAGVAGIAIAGGLAVGLEKSVKAAAGAQESSARLNQAFKASGDSAKKYAGQIDEAEAAGRNLGFMNSDLKESLGSLEVATHDPALAMKDLGTAEDVARFKHIGLVNATKLITSAMAGSTRAARQLGLSMQPIKTAEDKVSAAFKDHSSAAYKAALAQAKFQDKQKTSAAVVELLNTKLHGQAQVFAATGAGGLARYRAQMEALQENLGNALLPALTVLSQKLADATGWLAKHGNVAKIAVIGIAALAAGLMVLSVATTIAAAAATAFALPVLAVVAALAVLGVAIYEVVKHWGAITAFFTGVWDKIKGVFMAGIDFVKSHWRAFATALATIILGPIGGLVVLIATHWDKIKAGAVTVWNAIKGVLKGAWDAIKGTASAVWAGIVSVIKGDWNTIKGVFNTMGNVAMHVWDGVKATWSAAWKAMESAVVSPVQTVISWIQKLIGWISKIHIPHVHIPGSGVLSHIPGLQAGGIVTRPTLALVGEAGPEAVVPLGRAGRGMGGGLTLNVNLSGPVYGGDKRGVARELAGAIRDELVSIGRREGAIFAGYA